MHAVPDEDEYDRLLKIRTHICEKNGGHIRDEEKDDEICKVCEIGRGGEKQHFSFSEEDDLRTVPSRRSRATSADPSVGPATGPKRKGKAAADRPQKEDIPEKFGKNNQYEEGEKVIVFNKETREELKGTIQNIMKTKHGFIYGYKIIDNDGNVHTGITSKFVAPDNTNDQDVAQGSPHINDGDGDGDGEQLNLAEARQPSQAEARQPSPAEARQVQAREEASDENVDEFRKKYLQKLRVIREKLTTIHGNEKDVHKLIAQCNILIKDLNNLEKEDFESEEEVPSAATYIINEYIENIRTIIENFEATSGGSYKKKKSRKRKKTNKFWFF